jgi:hypothetical protein
MSRIMVIAALALAAAASAVDLGVGVFYAPAKVTGYVDEVREYSDKEFSLAGFKGRVSLGVGESFALALGLGFNDFVYRQEPYSVPEVAYVLSLPTFLTTLGADYAFTLGPVRPFGGGGAAFAREAAAAYGHSTADWYAGVYGEAGVRYPLAADFALEVAPQYTLLLDKPVVGYDGLFDNAFFRSENHSQVVELLVGVNYHF